MAPSLIFRPYRPSSSDSVYHNILPHRFQAGKTVFVTWRLSDSLPQVADQEKSIRRTQKRWLDREQLPFCPWTQNIEEILRNQYPEKLNRFKMIRFWVQENFDKKNFGSCALRHQKAIHRLWEAVREEEKWGLGIGDGVVCFNHVHLLMVLGDDANLKCHMERIKGRASRYLGLEELPELPKPVWQRYWFDHLVRDASKLTRIRKYIADHPVPYVEAQVSAEWVI